MLIDDVKRLLSGGRKREKRVLRSEYRPRRMMGNGRATMSLPLHNRRPVLPLLGHFTQHVAHDNRRGHQSVTLVFEHADFAAPHCLAQPAHIIDGNSRVFVPVVDHHLAVDIHVPEPNRLPALQTDQQINGRVGVCCGQFPDSISQPCVVLRLPFFLLLCRECEFFGPSQ